MNSIKKNILLTVSLFPIFITGCVSTPPKSDYTAFAEAGTSYASAVDKLLIYSGKIQVDSTSWNLLVSDNDSGMDLENYSKNSKQDTERLKVIADLRKQAKLLAEYFSLLESLSTSDAPERSKISIEGVVNNLGKLNLKLPNGTSALPALGSFMMDTKIRVALRNELEKRKDIIRNELYVHEKLLEKLGENISNALKLLANGKEKILVINPILDQPPIKDPEKWASTRFNVTYMPITADELTSTQNAAKKMRESFETLLSGEDPKSQINTLIYEINSIMTIIEVAKS